MPYVERKEGRIIGIYHLEQYPGQEYVDGEVSIDVELDAKNVGIEFDGVMCSATYDDQNGLIAVLIASQLQGQNFQPTKFHFSNGNNLVLTKENLQQFISVWMPFRHSFFAT